MGLISVINGIHLDARVDSGRFRPSEALPVEYRLLEREGMGEK